MALAAAVAASSAADLGPDYLQAVCSTLIERRTGDPTRQVQRYRDDVNRTELFNTAEDKHTRRGERVITADQAHPREIILDTTTPAERTGPVNLTALQHAARDASPGSPRLVSSSLDEADPRLPSSLFTGCTP